MAIVGGTSTKKPKPVPNIAQLTGGPGKSTASQIKAVQTEVSLDLANPTVGGYAVSGGKQVGTGGNVTEKNVTVAGGIRASKERIAAGGSLPTPKPKAGGAAGTASPSDGGATSGGQATSRISQRSANQGRQEVSQVRTQMGAVGIHPGYDAGGAAAAVGGATTRGGGGGGGTGNPLAAATSAIETAGLKGKSLQGISVEEAVKGARKTRKTGRQTYR